VSVEVVTADESSEREPSRVERWLTRRVRNDESGIALVWMSIFLMVLIGFAALAVDIGHGYEVAQRAQNAADAAALAGTIYLPGDLTTAQNTADAVAAANGFDPNSNPDVQVSAVQARSVSQLQVTVSEDVKTWFAKAIGFPTMHVSRKAVADYRPPVEMGSPSNQYGNDPDSSGTFGTPTYPNFWANVAGPASPKSNGDAYQGGVCGNADSCTSAPADTTCGYAGTNSDYDCEGYYYTVHVPSGGASVKLQAFDAGFVAVGDNCGANGDGSNLVGADALTAAQVEGWPAGVADNAAARYAPVGNPNNPNDPGQRYCTGDHSFDGDASLITTTYTVLGPASIPGDPNSAPATPICTKSYPGFTGDLAAQLTTGAPMPVTVNGVDTPEYLGRYFRQWDDLCPTSITTATGDYFIQIRTNLDTHGQPIQAGDGHNRFALRVAGGSNIGIYGNGKMGIYANVGGGTLTQFYLARLLPGDAGHTLTLALFDIGDGAQGGNPGELTIVPPPDSNLSPTDLSQCTMQLGTGAAYQPVNGTGCQITGVTTDGYGGKWLTIQVPIPGNYTCTVSNANNCWFRIDYQFSGYLDDTTSWTASLGGDPVRIVQ
jgi:Flp pilus assembly protein TadG